MAAVTGKSVRLKASGEAVSFTDEATTSSDNLVYLVTDAAKRVWGAGATITVEDAGVLVAASNYTVNRLAGTITFGGAAARTITVTGEYLPMTTVAEAKDFSFTTTAQNEPDTVFGDTDVTRIQVGKDVTGSIGRWQSVDTTFEDMLADDAAGVLELSIDGGTSVVFRARVRASSTSTTGAPRTLLEEGASFEGVADVDGRSHHWLY